MSVTRQICRDASHISVADFARQLAADGCGFDRCVRTSGSLGSLSAFLGDFTGYLGILLFFRYNEENEKVSAFFQRIRGIVETNNPCHNARSQFFSERPCARNSRRSLIEVLSGHG
jgi:hypothetical protein